MYITRKSMCYPEKVIPGKGDPCFRVYDKPVVGFR